MAQRETSRIQPPPHDKACATKRTHKSNESGAAEIPSAIWAADTDLLLHGVPSLLKKSTTPQTWSTLRTNQD